MDFSQLTPAQQQHIGQMVISQLAAQAMGGLQTGPNGQVTFKTVPSGTPSPYNAHGPGGLFSHPALEQPLYSAIITPWTGLQYMLPVRGTIKTDPLYGIITGVTATTGSEPVGVCDDPPTAGLLKLCMQHYQLGRESRQTSVIDISRGDRVTDRGEHTDFVMFGSPLGQDMNPMIPQMGFGWDSVGGVSEVAKRMIEFMTAWARDFARIIYTGNPANNTAQGGYKEPFGLDIIIDTGHVDAESGQACPAADSIIRSFNNLNITNGGTLVQGQLVNLVSYIYRNLVQLAAQTNLLPVEWVLAMPFSMFYEITQMWPIAYSTYRSQQSGTGTTVFIDNMSTEQRRDDMRGDLIRRRGQYLLIDGQKVTVVLDDAIAESTLANACFSSSIYFVPLRVLGNREATFLEFFDYNAAGVLRQARTMAAEENYSVSDGGRFLLHKKPPTNWCTQVVGLTEWRVVCTVPYLAARITDIAYCPLMHEFSGFTDSAYYRNGGRTDRNNILYRGSPSYYPPSV